MLKAEGAAGGRGMARVGARGTHAPSPSPRPPLSFPPSFFEDYKKNENKVVVVDEFLGVEHAKRIILEAMDLYNDLFLPKRMR